MPTLITITSVPQETVADNQLQVIARWKDSDKRTISKENRQRAVILPKDIWGADLGSIDNKAVRAFMHDAVEDLARSYLQHVVEESNWQRTQVPQEHFQLSNLLSWQAEQAVGRLTGEQIKAWIANSFTVKHVAEVKTPQVAKALGEAFVKLAGPNHGITKEKAETIIAKYWQNDDSDDNVGFRVFQRLDRISKKNNEDGLADID